MKSIHIDRQTEHIRPNNNLVDNQKSNVPKVNKEQEIIGSKPIIDKAHINSGKLNKDDIVYELYATNGQKVQIKSSAEGGSVSAYTTNARGQAVEIKKENTPAILNGIDNPLALHALLKNTWLKTSTLSDGETKLYTNPTLKGGMISSSSDEQQKIRNAYDEVKQINKLVAEGVTSIERQIQEAGNNRKEAILFIGNTRAGKSTLINLLTGVDLETKLQSSGLSGKSFSIELKNANQGLVVGGGINSETIIPKLWSHNKLTCWDCPGAGDNRGSTQDIANNFYIKHIFDSYEGVKIVAVASVEEVIGVDKFESTLKKLVDIRDKVNSSSSTKSLDNVYLLITKVDVDSGVDSVVAEIKERLSTRLSSSNLDVNKRKDLDEAAKVFNILSTEGRITIFRKPDPLGKIIEKPENILSVINKYSSKYIKTIINIDKLVSADTKLYGNKISIEINKDIQNICTSVAKNFRKESDKIIEQDTHIREIKEKLNNLAKFIDGITTKSNPQDFTNQIKAVDDARGKEIETSIGMLGFLKQIVLEIKFEMDNWNSPLKEVAKECRQLAKPAESK